MKFITVFCLLYLACVSQALAREQIRIVGSGTVYPFAALAAEQFGLNGKFKTPIVESTGTGGGFKLFCEGAGEDTPDINDASRKITDSEKTLCAEHGVDYIEIPIGFDGIVIAGSKVAPPLNLTKKQLFLALAREVPGKDGKIIKNTANDWSDIDPTLPHRPIRVYGPPPTSGTRDTFVEMVMDNGCGKVPEFVAKYPDDKERQKFCGLMREDGKYIEAGEDYNTTVQKLLSDEHALGVMGYGFYDENSGKIQAVKIEGIAPEVSSIEAGQYGISRRLYVYVKKQHISDVPDIIEFLQEITSENAIGADGYLVARGLLPVPQAQRNETHESVDKLKAAIKKPASP